MKSPPTDETDGNSLQHQFGAKEHDDDIAAYQKAGESQPKEDAAQDEEMI
jgi:hypothetical protein